MRQIQTRCPELDRTANREQADGTTSRLAISGWSLPSGGREGGGWADIFPRTDGPATVLTIGDAMGHGERAVWFQRQLRLVARSVLDCPTDASRVIEQIDRIACDREGLATYLIASMDLSARRLSVSRAGHPSPVIIDHRGSPTFAWAPTAGPLGLSREAAPPSHIFLTQGSIVVMYTDGLVHRRALPLGEGLTRLQSAATGTHTVPGADLARRLLHASDAVSPADDDVTVLVARLEPGTGSEHTTNNLGGYGARNHRQ
jgi:serine phosphatase RsbU (regulator of sigma subunit)